MRYAFVANRSKPGSCPRGIPARCIVALIRHVRDDDHAAVRESRMTRATSKVDPTVCPLACLRIY